MSFCLSVCPSVCCLSSIKLAKIFLRLQPKRDFGKREEHKKHFLICCRGWSETWRKHDPEYFKTTSIPEMAQKRDSLFQAPEQPLNDEIQICVGLQSFTY